MPPARIVAAAGLAALSLTLCGQATAQKPAARPAPPPRIEGIVRDPAGKPVEKALVMVRQAGNLTARTLSGRSDAAGRFTLEAPKAGLYDLRVEAPGLAPHIVERLAVPGAALAVTLRKGGAIEGVVRDNRGRPVGGARVDARGGVFLGTLSDPEAGRVRATTDAKGVFKLEGLATMPHTVTATAPGLGGARRDGVTPGAKIELFLASGGSVRGVVRGPDRRPLAGASVLIAPQMFGSSSTVERTDAAGVFQAWGLRPGAWHAIASHPDHAPAVAPIFLEGNAEQRVELTLGAPARLRGRLLDAAERPVPGAAVVLQEIEGQVVAPSLGEMIRAESDAQGRFTLERAPRALLALGATARGLVPKRIEAAPEGADLDLGDIVLDSGLAIRGHVRDASRQPVADAQVRAMARMRGPATNMSLETTSEADGTFALAGADAGMYSVSVEAAGYATAFTQAVAGETLELTLERAGSIVGTVVDEKGAPVPAFYVTASPLDDTGNWRPNRADGSEGHFELASVASGEWTVRVKAPDKAEGRVSGVKVRTGAVTDVGRVRLSPGAAVRGRVTDSAGSPIAGAGVWTETPGRFPGAFMTTWAGQRGGAYSDASGAFELLGVEAGRIDVVAEHPDFAGGRAAGVDVDAVRGASDVRVTLSRGGRIEGTARRRDGRPLERATVRVMASMPSGPGAAAAVAPDGSFTVEHVAPGTMRLLLSTDTAGASTSIGQQKEVEVREGETSVVEFLLRDILVSGTVTRRGEPAAGLQVALRGMTGQAFFGRQLGVVPATPSGPRYGSAVTRGDGTYELLATEPGPHMASVSSADGRINYPMRKVEVPDADTATVDFAFGGVTVSGQMVDAETSAPLSGNIFAVPQTGEDRRPANAQVAADGRFQIEVDPGDYALTARADGYAALRSPVSVGENGTADVRLALTRGLTISGRVLDAAGRPVGSLMVSAHTQGATPPGGSPNLPSGFGSAAPDGIFNIRGLSEGNYNLAAGDELAGFGTLADVAAGSKNVVLRLSPGGRVRASVVNMDGSPVPSAFVSVSKVDGRSTAWSRPARTDAGGMAELATPAGTVELTAGDTASNTEGTVTVPVSSGETAAVQLKLAPRKKDTTTR